MSTATTASPVKARIIFWGAEGAGKTTSVHAIHGKLKPDHRGDLSSVPTRLDPTVTYESFPIQLGSIGGSPTHLHVIAVPGAPALAQTRKQLLDEVDGLVLVLDSQTDRLEDNLASVAELRESLAAYGRSLEEIPVVVLYNKRDLGDPFTIEELHRKIDLADAAVFETVATETTGVLQALTTISKRVVRLLRERAEGAAPATLRETPSAASEPVSEPISAREAMEAAILAEEAAPAGAPSTTAAVHSTQLALDDSWPAVADDLKTQAGARIGADLEVVSVGTSSREGQRGVRVPLVLGNEAGETVTVELSLSLEPLLDDGSA